MFKIINDINISLNAKGLWMFLSTLENGSAMDITEIATHSNDSEELVIKAMNELIKTGYISKDKITNGIKEEYVYTINYEEDNKYETIPSNTTRHKKRTGGTKL